MLKTSANFCYLTHEPYTEILQQKYCYRFIVAVIHGSFPSSDANLLHEYMQWNLYFGTLLLVPGGKTVIADESDVRKLGPDEAAAYRAM